MYWVTGHLSVLKNEGLGKIGSHITQVEEWEVNEPTTENFPKTWESLLLKKVLLNPMKDINEPTQRKDLFRDSCEVNGKCCNVVINSRSTQNLVSTKVVDKLSLKKSKNLVPYKVSWLKRVTSC